MEIWLDTANVELVVFARELGILKGVTTNPTILSKSHIDLDMLYQKLIGAHKGPLAIQVLADNEREMIQQAKALSEISPRVIVKIPVTQVGLRAICALTNEGIPVLATAIFDLRQALFAFKAGALYLAPYLGRIADLGQSPFELLIQIQELKKNYGFEGKIMGAGIRTLTDAMSCIKQGICAMTLPERVFMEFVEDSEFTLLALKKFNEDWSQRKIRSSLETVEQIH